MNECGSPICRGLDFVDGDRCAFLLRGLPRFARNDSIYKADIRITVLAMTGGRTGCRGLLRGLLRHYFIVPRNDSILIK